MKLICAAICAAALSSIGISAQSAETQEKTKVKVDGGHDVKVIGCLARNVDGGYKLTDRDGRMLYALVGGEHLDKHVGQQVELRGKATDGHDGKVKIESETRTSGEEKTKERTELSGDVHALAVRSVKMLSSSCM